jgi:rod shape-determining protein MreD
MRSMHWVRFAVLILGTMVLQAGLGGVMAVTPRDVRPNLLLVVMVYFALYGLPRDVVITSFVIGLASDVIGRTIGPQMIGFGLCGTLLSGIRQYILIRKVPFQAIVILITGALASGLGHVLYIAKGIPGSGDLLNPLLWEPVYSGIIGPVLFFPLEWMMRLQEKRYRLGLR